ncbi:MAG TPA: beta-propeller fold lactonase family protein [Acidobacteriaceae bacterium]|jgi:6-phosphogluconolactonase (cycloisomerase 2 family)|nr:beta-propeller fold lactonase family protein [Acidobacteriaceae bacterium]
MKWSQCGRITLALVASLALGLSITACNPSFTLGYVYALTAKSNLINAYGIDSVSGALTPIPSSPYASGGDYPIAAAVDHPEERLYVVHENNNKVVEFSIGDDGTLASLNTYSTPGRYPIAVSIDPQNRFLFVVDSFAPAYNNDTFTPPKSNPKTPAVDTTNTDTQGCVVVYPISSTDGSLGTPVTDPVSGDKCFPVGVGPAAGSLPIGITATAFVNYLYVANQGTHSIYAYAVNYSNGVLRALTNNSFQAGVKPSAITSDPSGRFVYVTDQYSNQLLGYVILSSGALQSMVNGPFATDLYPNSIVADPRGLFLYVTNYNSNDVRAYTIDASTGNPSGVSTAMSSTGTGPTCVVIEPAYGRYVYVSNLLDNTISGFKLNPHTGVLTTVLNAPFPASGQPTCVATAANGAHPTQIITP